MRPAYFARRALDAMAREPYVTLVGTGTSFVAVLVTGLFAAALSGAERLLSSWAGEVNVSVYLAAGADLDRARAAAGAIAPGHAVEAVPGELALSRLAESLGEDRRLLEGVGPDALPDAVEVRVPGLSLAAVRDLAERLRTGVPGAEDVDYGNVWLERLERFLARARLAGIALLAALSLATAALVSNTLRLAVYARREEIEIMKLVGATDPFVGAPFLIEGAAQGLFGSSLAVGLLVALHAALAPRLAAAVRLAGEIRLADTLPWPLLVGLVAGGAALGLAGSALSVLRTLRRRPT
jgi:cell division transport system permease protein